MSKARVINKNGVIVRVDNASAAEIVRVIPYGEEVEWLEEYGNWVKLPDGWAPAGHLSPCEVTAGGGGMQFIVFSNRENEYGDYEYTCNMTFSEIMSAWKAGSICGAIYKPTVDAAEIQIAVSLSWRRDNVFIQCGDESTANNLHVDFERMSDLYVIDSGLITWEDPYAGSAPV